MDACVVHERMGVIFSIDLGGHCIAKRLFGAVLDLTRFALLP